jgi:hypothetical protein
VLTGIDKTIQQGAIFEGGATAGYQFRFPWLITLRDFAVQAWGVLQGFFGFLGRVGPSALSILSAVFDRLAPVGGAIERAFYDAVEYVARFVEAMGQLATTRSLPQESQFHWVVTLGGILQSIGSYAAWAYQKMSAFNDTLKTDPRAASLKKGVVDMLRDGAHWAGELAININQVYQGQKPDAAFAWLLPVSVALKAVVGWASAAGNAVLDFIGVFSGNAEALANNPGLAKFRQSLLEDVLPRLRTMATDVVAFLVGVVPPIFNTISGIFATLRPYVDGIGPSLRDASKYVISLVDAVARYFSGKEQDKNFKWVKTLLDDIKAVIDYISGIPDLLQKKFSGQEIGKESKD